MAEIAEVLLPKLGDSMVDAEVVEWLVQPGTRIEPADPLVSVDTGKVLADVPAPVSGVLVEVVVSVGAVVPVGAVLARVETD